MTRHPTAEQQSAQQRLLDALMRSGLSLPMPESMHDRWMELALMYDHMPAAAHLAVGLSKPDQQYLETCAHQHGIVPTTLCRMLVTVGVRALQLAEQQDANYKAKHYMKLALQHAHNLSANDRRFAREHLLNTQRDAPGHDGDNDPG